MKINKASLEAFGILFGALAIGALFGLFCSLIANA